MCNLLICICVYCADGVVLQAAGTRRMHGTDGKIKKKRRGLF
jgi:hypothetical protein